MSKSKYGEFEMTCPERRLYQDMIIAYNLAEHYENMAKATRKESVTAAAMFWEEVKTKRPMPKRPFVIRVLEDMLHIKIEKKPLPENAFKTPYKEEEE